MRHDDASYRAALRAVKASGQSVNLILDLLAQIKITAQESKALRALSLQSVLRGQTDDQAWIKTPNAAGVSPILHAWEEAAGRAGYLSPVCDRVLPAMTVHVFSAHLDRIRRADPGREFRRCEACEALVSSEEAKTTVKGSVVPVTVGRLRSLIGEEKANFYEGLR